MLYTKDYIKVKDLKEILQQLDDEASIVIVDIDGYELNQLFAVNVSDDKKELAVYADIEFD